MSVVVREYSTVNQISGPLLFVKNVRNVGYGELVRIRTPTGEERRGQVLEARSDIAVVQVFEGTSGLDVSTTSVRFLGETVKLPVSSDLLGRILDGSGRPIDGGPRIIPDEYWDVQGAPINPYAAHIPTRIHSNWNLSDRWNEHASQRTETSHLLRCRTSAQPPSCASSTASKSERS